MKPIETIHIFPLLTEELLTLLRGLTEDEWLAPSPVEGRSVKDLVSHLVDGSLRKLSMQRDRFSDDTRVAEIQTYDDLVGFIQTLNREWIKASRRLSPAILTDLLLYSEQQFHVFIRSLDPNAKALYPVAWAGEEESQNWFDIAREYTERWHHQMQIRLALRKPLLLDPIYTGPLYDTFMLALPYFYRDLNCYPVGYRISVTVTGRLNKSWVIVWNGTKWMFTEEHDGAIKSAVAIPDDVAWILFTNTDRNKEKYRTALQITGDTIPGLKILELITVMS